MTSGHYSDPVKVLTEGPVNPSAPRGLLVDRVTGGLIRLRVIPPLDTGGSDLIRTDIYMRSRIAGVDEIQLVASGNVTDVQTIYGLSHSTKYTFAATVTNDAFLTSDPSKPIRLWTGEHSNPGRVKAPVQIGASGGSITVSMTEPRDTGKLFHFKNSCKSYHASRWFTHYWFLHLYERWN